MSDKDFYAFATGDHTHGGQSGMTLRDYMAGQALAGLGTWMPPNGGGNLSTKTAMEARAIWAYEQADAMLAARGGE